MQDLAEATMEGVNPLFPTLEEEKQQQQQLKCPRCESTNTKFCYYNNYNLSQPRHFCKDCRRYWTKGGTLRNIPVGGGTRKNSKRSSPADADADADASNPKRLSTSAPADPSSTPIRLPKTEPLSVVYPPFGQEDRMLEITGTFSSLLASNGSFGGLLETFHSSDSGIGRLPSSTDQILLAGAPAPELQSSNDSTGSEQPAAQTENFLCLQGDSSCWLGGWPDLSIYTPGSSFQ